MTGERLTLWVIYDHPADHPGHFVLRRQFAGPGVVEVAPDYVLGTTLDEVRAQLPLDVFPLGRQPGDDPTILEVWV